MNNGLEELIIDNSSLFENLNDEKWLASSNYERKDILDKIFILCKEAVYNEIMEYKDDGLDLFKFKDYKIVFEFSDIHDDNSAGEYNHKKHHLVINSKYFARNRKGDGIYAFYVIEHKLFHALQDYLICKHSNFEKIMDKTTHWKIYRDTTNIEISLFGMEGKGSLHINTIYQFDKLENNLVYEVSKMFYVLNSLERDAVNWAKEKGDYLVKIANKTNIGKFVQQDYSLVFSALDYFKQRYMCKKMSNEQIFTLIDICFFKVKNKKLPESNLQANVMYDIACVAIYNRNIHLKEEFMNRLDIEIKSSKLQEYKFSVNKKEVMVFDGYVAEPEQDMNKFWLSYADKDFEDIQNLSLEYKKNNPDLMMWIAYSNDRSLLELINDVNYWKAYCIAYGENIKPEYCETVQLSLGNDIWNDICPYLQENNNH